MNVHFKSDERILGDSDFVQKALHDATEKMKSRYRIEAIGYNFDTIVERVSEIFKGSNIYYRRANNRNGSKHAVL